MEHRTQRHRSRRRFHSHPMHLMHYSHQNRRLMRVVFPGKALPIDCAAPRGADATHASSVPDSDRCLCASRAPSRSSIPPRPLRRGTLLSLPALRSRLLYLLARALLYSTTNN
jgi:hypothetical protein